MAVALYNRYRPRTFAEVVGQEHVTDALARALETGRLHHAYLFSGPRGCGKTSSARILAASLNCVDGPTPTPCGECEPCTSIRTGSSVDVVELDAASHGGVEDARDLRERVGFAPVGRYRVFIVDEAHMITKEGFNALLKVVEEPPPHVVFVFATTDPDKVLATIRSRTFHYQFGLVPPAVLREHLRAICTAEGAVVEDAVLPLVVRVGEGSVRDSLSVLDQLLAGAAAGGVTYAVASARLGLTDAILLEEAVDGLTDRDGAKLFGVVEKVVGAGQDPRRFAMDLLERLRDLVLLSAVPEARERGLLDTVPDDVLTRMRGQAQLLGLAELSRAADVVHAALVEMRGTVSPRLALELLCARLLLPAGAAGDVLVRLERLERGASAGAPTTASPAAALRTPAAPPAAVAARTAPTPPTPPAPASTTATAPGRAQPAAPVDPTPAAPAASAPAAATAVTPAASVTVAASPPAEPAVAAPAPGGADLDKVRTVWPDVLAIVAQESRVAHVLLSQHGSPAALQGSTLTLAFSNPGHGRTFEQRVDVVADALARVLGGRWTVVVGAPAGGAAAAAAPSAVPASAAPEPTPARGWDPPPPPPDEPADDDPVVVEPTSSAVGEDAALEMLRAGLGGTVL